ncbi:MAG: hypothetical protein M1826_005891 [Phylliscum demangeonii]|nr:MAG: hypothetical protein M1826_005891 [Phylliscum demangeonii]
MPVSAMTRMKADKLEGSKVSGHQEEMEKLLRLVRPLTAKGRRRRAWDPCVDCLRYRPTRKSYWITKDHGKLSEALWETWLQRWTSGYSMQCPECWFQEVGIGREEELISACPPI